ncbi:transmembrane protein 102 isoform X2 [Bos indicus]|uniref:Transmembrane protein 102 isoform X2 n=1 Tax=Bos indicus TaxID=9915 RepID=A0A6P5DHF9_BOSIN|nr:transmembrane protein 102 isoform X2 [Bos taurus]XP_027373511.1 transmembrane protein 102 isoform X2 [Bos indicus x Bos taurus]
MASAVWGNAPWWSPPPPAPARPLTDIDFCSGAQLQELTQLIQELGVQESWNDGPKPGPDLLQAKDFVFSLLNGTGQELQLDMRSCYAWLCLPEQVRGTSVREAWQDCLGPPVPGGRDWIHPTDSREGPRDPQSSVDQPHSDIIEPEAHESLEKSPSNVSVPESPQQNLTDIGFPSLSEETNDDVTKAADVSPGPQPSEAREAWPTLCPAQVAAWFFASLAAVAESLFPVPGAPRLVHAARHAGFTTILLATPGPPRRLLLFDLIPVVSVAGWPQGARSHSWAGPLASESSSFYLVPGGGGQTERPGASGWQLCFARQELALKARIPTPLLQAHAAAQALLRPLVAGTRAAAPYLLRTLLYWACERLPALYLARPENAGACCLGLLDELGRVLEARTLPHYFLSGQKLRAGDGASSLLGALALLRGDPARALRAAVEEAKAARKGGGLAGVGAGSH